MCLLEFTSKLLLLHCLISVSNAGIIVKREAPVIGRPCQLYLPTTGTLQGGNSINGNFGGGNLASENLKNENLNGGTYSTSQGVVSTPLEGNQVSDDSGRFVNYNKGLGSGRFRSGAIVSGGQLGSSGINGASENNVGVRGLGTRAGFGSSGGTIPFVNPNPSFSSTVLSSSGGHSGETNGTRYADQPIRSGRGSSVGTSVGYANLGSVSGNSFSGGYYNGVTSGWSPQVYSSGGSFGGGYSEGSGGQNYASNDAAPSQFNFPVSEAPHEEDEGGNLIRDNFAHGNVQSYQGGSFGGSSSSSQSATSTPPEINTALGASSGRGFGSGQLETAGFGNGGNFVNTGGLRDNGELGNRAGFGVIGGSSPYIYRRPSSTSVVLSSDGENSGGQIGTHSITGSQAQTDPSGGVSSGEENDRKPLGNRFRVQQSSADSHRLKGSGSFGSKRPEETNRQKYSSNGGYSY